MWKNIGAPRWESSFSSTLTVRWLIQIGQTALLGCNLLGLYCHLVGRRDNTQRPCLDCLKFPFTYAVPSRLTHSCVIQITQWYKPEILFVLTLSFWSSVFVVTVLLNFNYMLHNALFLRLQNKFQIKNGFILCLFALKIVVWHSLPSYNASHFALCGVQGLHFRTCHLDSL